MFNKSILHTLFKNLKESGNKTAEHHYVVVNEHGTYIAQIVFNHNEMMIEVDNFPSEKKYYNSGLPIRSINEFMNDVQRAGVTLLPTAEVEASLQVTADFTISSLQSAARAALIHLRRMIHGLDVDDQFTEQLHLNLSKCHDDLKIATVQALTIGNIEITPVAQGKPEDQEPNFQVRERNFLVACGFDVKNDFFESDVLNQKAKNPELYRRYVGESSQQ